jgi:hypothetical protein
MPQVKTAERGRALYATLPRAFAFDARHHDLDPVELVIVAGLLTAARFARGDELHAMAFGTGQKAIKKERRLADQHKSDWQKTHAIRRRGQFAPAPKRDHVHKLPTYKAGRTRKTLKAAGAFGYKHSKVHYRKRPPPDRVTLSISKSRLLTIAGLSRDGSNLARLNQALDKFCKPIKVDGCEMPPLLHSIEEQPSGKLLLDVSGDWLAMQFIRVPLPVPTRSPVATALYLFLLCIPTGPHEKGHASLKTLCQRIGINVKKWRQRAFDRALDIVNDHLERLDGDALRESKIKIPAAYKVVPVDEYRIRLQGIARPSGPDDFSGELRRIKTERERRTRPEKIERVRVSIERVRVNGSQAAEETENIAYEQAQWERQKMNLAQRREASASERERVHRRALEEMRVAGHE